MALPISPFFNYLLLVYVIKMSLFDLYYEYELLLKYTFMKILFNDFLVKSIRKTKSVIFEKMLLQTLSLETLQKTTS